MARYDYIRDPQAIYRASQEAVEKAADLSALADDLKPLALRLIHACAMPEIAMDIVTSPHAVAAGRAALKAGAAILCDGRMTAEGIIRARLPARSEVICKIGEPQLPALAQMLGNTQSAAAVDLWTPRLKGSIVAIGNAPTALYRLLEAIAEGAPKPALILGFPIGFIGAAESKEALIRDAGDVPFISLRGRFGGSALAAAAVNALADDKLTNEAAS
ncbi:MAG TPA: precorrin-8X methylmutase [Alphaproteobacteria bacterium]|nr:precorrin-8X methylmutase [Alphaproteobacteria bacterium]